MAIGDGGMRFFCPGFFFYARRTKDFGSATIYKGVFNGNIYTTNATRCTLPDGKMKMVTVLLSRASIAKQGQRAAAWHLQ
jgi:hypothetical protein